MPKIEVGALSRVGLCIHIHSIYMSYLLFWFQGSGGVTVKKTNMALIIGIYDEPMTPGQCNMIVERLGDYLFDQGF